MPWMHSKSQTRTLGSLLKLLIVVSVYMCIHVYICPCRLPYRHYYKLYKWRVIQKRHFLLHANCTRDKQNVLSCWLQKWCTVIPLMIEIVFIEMAAFYKPDCSWVHLLPFAMRACLQSVWTACMHSSFLWLHLFFKHQKKYYDMLSHGRT